MASHPGDRAPAFDYPRLGNIHDHHRRNYDSTGTVYHQILQYFITPFI